MIVRPVLGREFCGVCVNYINNKNAQKPTFITENNVSQHVLIWTSTLVLMWQINVVCCCVNAGYCCQSLVLLTADLRPALEPYLLLSALYGVFRLLPDLCRLPLGPEPEGVRVLAEKGVLSVELALSVLSRPPGVEVFLGTPEPKPMGLGRSVLLPDRMLEVLLTPDPRRPSSDSLRLMLEPYLLPGLEPWAEARLS